MIKRLAMAGIFRTLLLAQAIHIKPGLWEATSTNNMAAAMIPPDALAKMSPEQRAQMENIIKQSGNTVLKLCYTQEMLNKGMNYNQNSRGGTCKNKVISSNGYKQVSEISCEGEKTKSTGTVTVETTDPEHYAGVVQMQTAVNGQNRDMTIKISGKWLGSDCGDVKPRDYTK